LNQRIRGEVRKVKKAILSLVEQGWLAEIKGNDSRIRYRLSSERKAH
jgi:DNA-binding transcriptional regulator PaaX